MKSKERENKGKELAYNLTFKYNLQYLLVKFAVKLLIPKIVIHFNDNSIIFAESFNLIQK